MHIYSVLNKLFTPKIEQNKVQDNTNEQKTNFQDGNKEKKYPSKPGSPSQAKNGVGNKGKTSYQETARVLFAKDGDTFLGMYNKEKQTFRLAGIDAPEKGKAWAKEATDFLNETIKGKSVYLEFLGKDKYEREIVEVYLDKEKNFHVNQMLLQAGLATSERYKNNKGEHTHNIVSHVKNELTEAVAKIKDVGMWSGEPPAEKTQDPGIFDDDSWRDQLNSENKSSNSEHKTENNEPVFNPFANPTIEPLDVFPKGVTSNEEIILKSQKSSESSGITESEPIKVQSDNPINTTKENIEPVFNPFANPPIEPLDVFPKGITSNEELVIKEDIKFIHPTVNKPTSDLPELSEDIIPMPEEIFFDDNNIMFDNQPIDLDSMPSYMDDFPPTETNIETNALENIQEEKKIKSIDIRQEEMLDSLESKNTVVDKPVIVEAKPKIVLKIGAKKPTIQQSEELQPTLDIPLKIEDPKIIVESNAPTITENPLFKEDNVLSEDDPFSINVESDTNTNTNNDHLAILDEFDCMGEKFNNTPIQEETTKKRKLGK